MPFAVSATTCSGASAETSTNERTCVAERRRGGRVLDLARRLAARRDARTATISLICCSPVCSPTGAAPARHILIPLYCAGLWLAVNIAPGASSVPGREVDDVGGAQPDVGDVGPGQRRALDERRRERSGRRPHVAAHDDVLRAGEVRERVADAPRERLVDLVGIDPAYVVGLEDRRSSTLRRATRAPAWLGSRSQVMVAPGLGFLPVPAARRIASGGRHRSARRSGRRRRDRPRRHRRLRRHSAPPPRTSPHRADQTGRRVPTIPSSVTMRPSQSTPVSPYVSVTSFDVGTTTIMFGASRYGPFAPLTFQFGKYDVLDLDRLADLGDVEGDLVDVRLHVAHRAWRDRFGHDRPSPDRRCAASRSGPIPRRQCRPCRG